MGGILQAIIDPGAVQRDSRQQDLQAEGLRLRNAELQQQAEHQRMENEQRQRSLRDMDILSRAYVNTDRSPMAVQRYAITNGITPAGWKNHVDALKSAAGLRKEEIEAENAVNTQIAQRLHAVTQAVPEARAGLWERTRAELLAHDPNLQLPDEPTEENLRPVMIGLGYHAVLTKEAEQIQKIASEKAQADRAVEVEKRAKVEEERKAALFPVEKGIKEQELENKINPPVSQQMGSPQQQFIAEYRRLRPGSTVDQAIRAYTQIQGAPAREEGRTRAANTRADRSYQFSARELDAVGKPIIEAVARVGRLQTTLAQGTPQADALVAPELLTVMAGGQGSGLRMNEAEIARIVGGRSHWENLRGAIQKWSLDPSKAGSITPEQRQQIRALVNEVDGRLKEKQKVLDQAAQDLVGSDDPLEHRKVVAATRKRLTDVDQAPPAADTGQIRVKRKSDGKIGTMPAANFDASKYDKL